MIFQHQQQQAQRNYQKLQQKYCSTCRSCQFHSFSRRKISYFPILLLLFQIAETAKDPITAATSSSSSSGVLTSGDNGQRFAMEPQDQTAIVGSRVTLPCRVIDKLGSLQWTKDDFGLGEHRNLSGFERYSMVGSDEEGDFSLDIYPVMLDDDAKYQCQVGPGPLGQPGIRSRFATLTVLVPPEAPKIVQGDYLVTTEDREIELECISVGGKPAAEITWIDGLGNVLSKGIDYVKESLPESRRFTAKSILKLTPKKEHHNTTFTCQAQNTADRTYRSAKLLLEVKYAPKVSVSVVSGALAGGRIAEDSEVRLSCRADANPNDLNYKWFINDEPVIGDYTTEMIIHNVSRKFHDAIVKCEVFNAVGKSEESETLDISYGPEFRHQPKSVQADIGSLVTLSCDVDGNPPADIVWINGTSDREIGGSPNLTIHVDEYTAGRYYCKASVIGFPEIDAEINVYLKLPPRITSPKRQFGIIGDNANLECIAFSVAKAKTVLWSFNGHEINISSSDPEYSILEDHLQDGIKSILIIRESQPKHFGQYNCTVINDYGRADLQIHLIAQKTIPILMIIVGSVSFVTVILIIVIIMMIYLRRGKKKLPPADVIPSEHHHHHNHHSNEKVFNKESDRSSNLSDLKVDIRSGSCEPEYSETCSGTTESITTRLATNLLNTSTTTTTTSSTLTNNNLSGLCNGGVPLAGPVKIPNDFRYSGDYSDNLVNNLQQQQQPILIDQQQQQKTGQHNNGFDPFIDYALNYSPPPLTSLSSSRSKFSNTSNSNSSMATVKAMPLTHMNGNSSSSSSAISGSQSTIAGQTQSQSQQQQSQLPTPTSVGNMSLNRNRQHETNGNNGMNSLQSGLLGQSLLQNGLSIDPRFNATYGNPYLRTSNTSLPPLPPPSTANPAATPAPPPYHSTRNHQQHQQQHHINYNSLTNSINPLGSNSQSSLYQLQQQPTQQQQQLHSLQSSSQSITGTTASLSLQSQPPPVTPSGQFILPSNGNLKKGSLATHV